MIANTNADDAGDPTIRRVRWRRLGLVGLLLPLLAATVLVWSTTGREDHLDRVPVAVVNNDTILEKPQPMAAGRALAGALTEPSSEETTNLDWSLADTDDAAQGLRDGDYYAVLTIPPDFSKAILSSGTDDPFQGQVTLKSNAAASTTVPFISEAVADAAATSLGNQTTQGYLGNVYDGFNQIASSNQKAASSASQLAQGADQVAKGATDLDSGADQLAGGLGQLATGADELEGGTTSLRQGADDLASGASDLARGARELDAGASDLAGSARTLARKDTGFAGKARQVAAGATGVSRAVHGLSRGTEGVAFNIAVLARICGREGATDVLCNALDRARDRAIRVAEGSVAVDRAAGEIARSTRELAVGAGELAAGTRRLAAGAGSLSRAGGQVSQGADGLSDGATSLAQGATETDQAASSLAAGASSSATAGDELASGSASLSSGAASTDEGANQLSQGLAQGASESPTYSKNQKKSLETTVSEPVVLTHTVQHTSHDNGWLIGLVLGAVLWLAALLAMLLRNVGSVLQHAGAPISSRRLTWVQLRPTTGLALLQGVAVLAALPLLQVSTAAPLSLALLTLLAAATFSLVGVALRWAFGGIGVVAFVLLFALQAAALGNVIPIETAPNAMQVLNGVLPLTAYVNGASQLVTGGHVWSVAGVVTVLLAWSAGAGLLALMVVRNRRLQPVPRTAPSTA